MKTAVVYDIKKRQAASLADWLEQHGYQVIRQREEQGERIPGSDRGIAVDLLVVQIDASYEGEDAQAGTARDYEAMLDVVSRKIHEAFAVVDEWLPALEKGQGKRIAFLTERCASIRECKDKGQYARHMILAGVNMQAKLLYNRLRKEGYVMRCFAMDDPEEGGAGFSCGDYITMDFCYDEQEPYIHSEENRFVMRDGAFREISW